MTTSAGRKPDYQLRALNKKTDERTGKIGAGWKNGDGSISLVLDMLISLPSDRDIVYTLFPAERDK